MTLLSALSAEALATVASHFMGWEGAEYSDEELEALIKQRASRETRQSLETATLKLAYVVRRQNAALAKAHEAAEVSECRIAEVYDRIVKARDIVRPWLEPGLEDFRDLFQLLQDAKYGLGGRTNVAGTIAALTRGETP